MLHVIIIKFLTQVKKGQIRRLLSEAVAYELEQGQAALPTWENTALPVTSTWSVLPIYPATSPFQRSNFILPRVNRPFTSQCPSLLTVHHIHCVNSSSLLSHR